MKHDAEAAGARGASSKEHPTRASESQYNQDIGKATTSKNLTDADIAWHAVNTYGWDCEEVVARGQGAEGYFVVRCSSGIRLRVYPRFDQHPRITNEQGTYE